MVLHLNTIKLIKVLKLGYFGKMIPKTIGPKNGKTLKASQNTFKKTNLKKINHHLLTVHLSQKKNLGKEVTGRKHSSKTIINQKEMLDQMTLMIKDLNLRPMIGVSLHLVGTNQKKKKMKKNHLTCGMVM